MIVVDSREPWERVFSLLSKLGVDHELEALNGPENPYADYLIADRECGVQRKEVNDFVSSLDSLKDELYELRENHELSILLIEGNWGTAGDRIALRRGKSLQQTITISSLHNFVVSQQMRGTMFVRTSTLAETCRVLVSLDEYLDGEQGPPVDQAKSPRMLLELLPYVGPETAEKVIAEYGSPYKALMCVGTWAEEVDGIGMQTQNAVLGWLDE